MTKKMCLLYLAFFFSACAEPDYLKPQVTAQNTPETPTESCDFIFEKFQTCIKAEWKAPPNSTEPAELLLTLTPDTPLRLNALLWMPSMGHGSAPVKVTPLGNGKYSITKMYFIMPGDWDVRLFLMNEKNEVVDQMFIQLVVP